MDRDATEQRPTVTVLTDPMPWGRELFSERARRMARLLRDLVRPQRKFSNHAVYRGHFAVTRSLVEGLRKIDVSFNYNPRHANQLADTVIVLADVRTLRQAIRLKQRGKIKTLFAGPNIVVFSSDHDSILAAPEIDCVIAPCDWVIDVYVEDNPSLVGRCYAWPAGVDTEYWKPDESAGRNRILIFEKQNKGRVGPVKPYADYLGGLGWEVNIVEYGSFSHPQYRDMLRETCLMIGFVTDESQGIAWAEAWSTDVPTLIWKNTSNVYRGRRYRCSTAPYLRPENGRFFDDLEDFKAKFAYWHSHREDFAARTWTLENMSDEVCASMLYQKVTEFRREAQR